MDGCDYIHVYTDKQRCKKRYIILKHRNGTHLTTFSPNTHTHILTKLKQKPRLYSMKVSLALCYTCNHQSVMRDSIGPQLYAWEDRKKHFSLFKVSEVQDVACGCLIHTEPCGTNRTLCKQNPMQLQSCAVQPRARTCDLAATLDQGVSGLPSRVDILGFYSN